MCDRRRIGVVKGSGGGGGAGEGAAVAEAPEKERRWRSPFGFFSLASLTLFSVRVLDLSGVGGGGSRFTARLAVLDWWRWRCSPGRIHGSTGVSDSLLCSSARFTVFVASRLNVPGAWQMPQEGIEDGEDPQAAAIRELREETGIVSVDIISEVPKWLTYDFPPAVKAKVNRLWGGGEWHGQAQKWFLMRFKGDDNEVNLANGEADAEFSEWKWENPEDVIEQAVDYKRPVYEEVMRNFKPCLNEGKSEKCKSSRW